MSTPCRIEVIDDHVVCMACGRSDTHPSQIDCPHAPAKSPAQIISTGVAYFIAFAGIALLVRACAP